MPTTRQFKSKAERLFRSANPTTVKITWTHGPVTVTWADGSKGVSGVFTAEAEGYRTRPVVAGFSPTIGWSVR